MTVTQIIPLDKRRSKVFLDGDLAFALYRGELKQYRLEEGAELSRETYDEIVTQVLWKRAKERALYLLKASDKTSFQIRRKLEEGYYPAQVIDQVIGLLEKYRYLDDLEYARRYVEYYGTSRSRQRLALDLSRKGLDREQISRVLEEQPVEEEEQIKKFLRKKGYEPGAELPWEERRKWYAALMRKGFSSEAVRRVMGGFEEF